MNLRKGALALAFHLLLLSPAGAKAGVDVGADADIDVVADAGVEADARIEADAGVVGGAAPAIDVAADPAIDVGADSDIDVDADADALVDAPDAALSLVEAARLAAPTSPFAGRLRTALDLDAGEWAASDEAIAAAAEPGALPFPLGAVAARYDIPVAYNDAVAHYIAYFQGPGRRWFTRWMERSGRYVPLFRSILREHGLPEDLVYLSMIESGFSMTARSWAAAVGPWQFIPGTGRMFDLRSDFWVDERQDFEKSTRAAARFLGRLHEAWGDWYLAWAGYNAGPGRVKRAVDRHGTTDFWELAAADGAFAKETRHYVPKLIAAALIAKHPEDFGFEPIEREAPLEWETVELEDATDLAVVARCAGVEVEAIEALNPELRRWATPPVPPGGAPYRLRLPSGTAERFAENFAAVAPNERLTFRAYEVQPGDTLGAIALMWDTSVEAVMRTNHIRDARRLRIGQELIIPVPPDAVPRGSRVDRSQNVALRQARASSAGRRVQQARDDGAWHVLAPGETLGHVALRYGVSVERLQALNEIRDVRKVRAGQRLRVR